MQLPWVVQCVFSPYIFALRPWRLDPGSLGVLFFTGPRGFTQFFKLVPVCTTRLTVLFFSAEFGKILSSESIWGLVRVFGQGAPTLVPSRTLLWLIYMTLSMNN